MKKYFASFIIIISSSIATQAACPTSLSGTFTGTVKKYRFSGAPIPQYESIEFGTVSVAVSSTVYNRTTSQVSGFLNIQEYSFRTAPYNSITNNVQGQSLSVANVPFYFDTRSCQGFVNVNTSTTVDGYNGFSLVVTNGGAQLLGTLYYVRSTQVVASVVTPETFQNIEFSISKP